MAIFQLNLWLCSMSKNCLPLLNIIWQHLTWNQPYPRAYYPSYPTLPMESAHRELLIKRPNKISWSVSELSICFLTNFLSDRAVWNQVYFPKLCLCQTNIVYWCHRVLWANHSRHGFNYPGSLANESLNVRIEDVLCLEQTLDSNYNGKPKHCVCIFPNYLYNIIFMSLMEI